MCVLESLEKQGKECKVTNKIILQRTMINTRTINTLRTGDADLRF